MHRQAVKVERKQEDWDKLIDERPLSNEEAYEFVEFLGLSRPINQDSKKMDSQEQPELSAYQIELHSLLKMLEYASSKNGAERGHKKCIPEILFDLQELQKKNPEEHAAFLKSNSDFEKLYIKYPSWSDSCKSETLEQKKPIEDYHEEDSFAFQKELQGLLVNLEYVTSRDGADRGHGKYIAELLFDLRQLKKVNPEEHDRFLKSNPNFHQLYTIFPNWTDKNNKIQAYTVRDIGIFSTLSSDLLQKQKEQRAKNPFDPPEQCSIM